MTTDLLKVLCVDDEPEVLQGLKLTLRRNYRVSTAGCGIEALGILENEGPFAIVISDMRMPEMNGAEFLSLVRMHWPETTRILLTGYREMNNAIRAINEGQIFRFLTKPFPADQLLAVFEDASNQYRLVVAEKELLNKTLKGSINLMIELISLIDPEATGKYAEQKRMLEAFTNHIQYKLPWEIEIAAVLSQIGLVTIPAETRRKMETAKSLSDKEQAMIAEIPLIGSKLIMNIPRLANVAEIVKYQRKNYDGSGFPNDDVRGEHIPLGARVLHIVNDFYDLLSLGKTPLDAFTEMNSSARSGVYDMALLKQAIESLMLIPAGFELIEVDAQNLKVGDKLITPIYAASGRLLVARGVVITAPIVEKLKHYASLGQISERASVERPEQA